jgi:hypothetical protein
MEMGSHSTQAVAVTRFLVGFTFVSAGLAAGGSILMIALGFAALDGSSAVLYKIKSWEHATKFCSLARVAVW